MKKNIHHLSTKIISPVTICILLLMMILPFIHPKQAEATAFSEAFVRLDTMKAAQTTGGTVCAKASGGAAGTEAKISVTFPSDFTLDTTAANWSTTVTNLPAGGSAMVGIGSTASSVVSKTVTWPISDISDTTLYCFNFSGTTTLTNPTAGTNKTGTIISKTSGDVAIDTSAWATAIVTDDTITVTAVVPALFSLAFSFDDDGTGVDAFTGDLSSTSVVSTDGTTATIGTNAENGYHVWMKSANAGLLSTITGETIATPGTVDDSPSSLAAQEGWVVDVDETTDSSNGDGALSIDAEYNGADTNSGGDLSTTFTEVAICTGTTDADVITLIGRAKPSAFRAAGIDYTDTLTVVAAGRF